jgi:hypothetical protein
MLQGKVEIRIILDAKEDVFPLFPWCPSTISTNWALQAIPIGGQETKV